MADAFGASPIAVVFSAVWSEALLPFPQRVAHLAVISLVILAYRCDRIQGGEILGLRLEVDDSPPLPCAGLIDAADASRSAPRSALRRASVFSVAGSGNVDEVVEEVPRRVRVHSIGLV